jgi:predicted nucleotidyltransferase
MADREDIVSLIAERADYLEREYSARRVGVFGSYARDEAHQGSDLDVLVEFERPTFKNFMGMKLYLEDLTGLAVDVVTPKSLRGRLREHILGEVRYVS